MTDNEFDKKGGRDSPLTFSSIILSLSRDRDEKKKHSLHFSLYVSRFDVSRSRCVRPSSREKYGFFKLLHVFFFFLPFFLSPSSFRKQARQIYTRPIFTLLSFFFLKRILDRIVKTRLPFLRVLASRSMFPPYIIRRNKRRESELVKRWLISRSRWFNRWWKKWNLYRRTFAPENSDFTEFFFPLLLFI